MRQLGSLDAQFLNVESATTVGHVGALVLLDPATAAGGELTLAMLRDLVESRLHLASLLRQRVVEVPLGLGRPYWVDDPDFDLEFHLREIALPGDGTEHQLGEQVSRIHARPLDRRRPLWEMYLVHNVEGGRVALYTKVHHAAIDGVSGVEILATVMDSDPEPRAVTPPDRDWRPDSVPSGVEILGRGVLQAVRQPAELARRLPRSLPHLTAVPGAAGLPGARIVSGLAGAVAHAVGEVGAVHGAQHRRLTTPRTPLNAPITAHRRFGFGSLPLEEVRRVKQAHSVSVNDVVLTLCAAALRRWLLDHDALPEAPLVAAVPVSVRGRPEGGERPGPGGNEVSVMLAELPTHLADPRERLAFMRDSVAEARRDVQAVPATILQDLSAAVPTALNALAARSLFKLMAAPGPPFNLFVSNVPGPQQPLYVAGARVTALYPVSAVSDLTGGLNVTLFSYDGSVEFGLVSCRELVPDVWNLVDYLRDALAELSGLSAGD